MPASGAPTETEIQTQWRNVVRLLDLARVFSDGLLGSGQEVDQLITSIEGDYTPDSLPFWAGQFRGGLSALQDESFIFQALSPILFEYGKRLKTDGAIGSGYETPVQLRAAVYERFINASLTVETRALTFDTSATKTGTGNGDVARVTVDENGHDLEACHVEKKVFRCRKDQNSGANEFAEEFEMIAQARSPDNLELASFGSGATQASLLRNRNAGSGPSGSLLRNSSFSSYDATATNHFASWVLASGTIPTQDLTNYYQTFPNSSVDGSLTAAADFRLKQSLSAMRANRFESTRPYFLRVMVNATIGTAIGGNVILHLGSQSVSTTVLSIAASGWTEIIIPLDENCWFKNFNQDDFNVEIEWSGRTSGSLIFDDMIFVGMTDIDGTFWAIRQNAATPASWLVDDEIAFTDTQADPTKGKIQHYLVRSGLGYLPHSATPTFTDP